MLIITMMPVMNKTDEWYQWDEHGAVLRLRAALRCVVFSCVILEPTYNHGREGRGNSVAEGKSAGTRHLSELWVEKQIKELLDASASRRLRVGVPRRGPDAYLDGAVHGSAVRVLVSPRRARAARVSSLRARASGAAAERRAHSRRTGWRRFFSLAL